MLAYLGSIFSSGITKSKEIGLSKPDNSEQEKKIKAERVQKINKVAAKLQNQGITVMSPISQNYELAKENDLPDDAEFWRIHNIKALSRCDILMVLMLDGWESSDGLTGEIKFAEQKNMPIIYIDEELRIGG